MWTKVKAESPPEDYTPVLARVKYNRAKGDGLFTVIAFHETNNEFFGTYIQKTADGNLLRIVSYKIIYEVSEWIELRDITKMS